MGFWGLTVWVVVLSSYFRLVNIAAAGYTVEPASRGYKRELAPERYHHDNLFPHSEAKKQHSTSHLLTYFPRFDS
jgi:hypothetical protein